MALTKAEMIARGVLLKLHATRAPEMQAALIGRGLPKEVRRVVNRLSVAGLLTRRVVRNGLNQEVELELTDLGRAVAGELRPWTEESAFKIALRIGREPGRKADS